MDITEIREAIEDLFNGREEAEKAAYDEGYEAGFSQGLKVARENHLQMYKFAFEQAMRCLTRDDYLIDKAWNGYKPVILESGVLESGDDDDDDKYDQAMNDWSRIRDQIYDERLDSEE